MSMPLVCATRKRARVAKPKKPKKAKGKGRRRKTKRRGAVHGEGMVINVPAKFQSTVMKVNRDGTISGKNVRTMKPSVPSVIKAPERQKINAKGIPMTTAEIEHAHALGVRPMLIDGPVAISTNTPIRKLPTVPDVPQGRRARDMASSVYQAPRNGAVSTSGLEVKLAETKNQLTRIQPLFPSSKFMPTGYTQD